MLTCCVLPKSAGFFIHFTVLIHKTYSNLQSLAFSKAAISILGDKLKSTSGGLLGRATFTFFKNTNLYMRKYLSVPFCSYTSLFSTIQMCMYNLTGNKWPYNKKCTPYNALIIGPTELTKKLY